MSGSSAETMDVHDAARAIMPSAESRLNSIVMRLAELQLW